MRARVACALPRDLPGSKDAQGEEAALERTEGSRIECGSPPPEHSSPTVFQLYSTGKHPW